MTTTESQFDHSPYASEIMYDAAEWRAIPDDAQWVMGYINGAYKWPEEAWAKFAKAKCVRLQIFIPGDAIIDDGDGIDIEAPDAATKEGRQAAVEFVRMRPGRFIYTSAECRGMIEGALTDAGLSAPFGLAEWTGEPHLIENTVFTQFADPDHGADGNYDVSLVSPDFNPEDLNKEPQAQPTEEDDMQLYVTNEAGTGFIVRPDLSGKKGVDDATDAAALLASGLYKEVKLTEQQINDIPDL